MIAKAITLKRVTIAVSVIGLLAGAAWWFGIESPKRNSAPDTPAAPALTQAEKAEAYDRYQRALTWYNRGEKKREAGDMKAALTLYDKAGIEGDPAINSILINNYMQAANGFPTDIEKAESFVRAMPAEPQGRYLITLARFHQMGSRGAATDLPRAAALIEDAIGTNYEPAYMVAFNFYSNVRHPLPYYDNAKAMAYIDKAIAASDAPAPRMTKARYLFDQNDPALKAEAISLLEEVLLTERRNPNALMTLGDFFYERGEPGDLKRAARHYNSLETPSPIIAFRQGEILRAKAKTKGDWAEAREHYVFGANARHIPAMIMMGHIHRLGLAEDPKPDVALSYYEAIYSPGGNPAGHFIGAIYQAQTPPDYIKAIAAYQSAMDARVPAGYVMMARLYEHGHGVPKDEAKAFELMHEAALDGSNLGRAGMADYYERGIGTQRDFPTARIWKNKIRTPNAQTNNGDVIAGSAGIPPFTCDICDPKTD